MFGIGEGKILVALEKTIFAPNEPIRGKATLSLSQPKKARSLRLDIIMLQQSGAAIRLGPKQKNESTQSVCFSKQLSGERTYGINESFDFEVLAPESSSLQLPPELGAVASVLNSLSRTPRCFLRVSLDNPMEMDIGGQVEIQIKPSK